jgi:hypothetical protein
MSFMKDVGTADGKKKKGKKEKFQERSHKLWVRGRGFREGTASVLGLGLGKY